MKLAVTKKMAQLLNNAARDHGAPYVFRYISTSTRVYRLQVRADIYAHHNDYISKSGKMRVIVVEYPPEYYAGDASITTNDLINIYHAGDTFDTFAARVLSEYEI